MRDSTRPSGPAGTHPSGPSGVRPGGVTAYEPPDDEGDSQIWADEPGST